MTLTVRTDYRDTVVRIFAEQFRHIDIKTPDALTVTIEQTTDERYRDLANWAADAFGCGLIVSWEISRD
jgi:hypothetical protein